MEAEIGHESFVDALQHVGESVDEGLECAGSVVQYLDLRRFGLVADMGVFRWRGSVLG